MGQMERDLKAARAEVKKWLEAEDFLKGLENNNGSGEGDKE